MMKKTNRYGLRQDDYQRLTRLLIPERLNKLPPPFTELWALIMKESASCLFAGLFFIVLALSTVLPLGGLPRYDFILIMAIAIQLMMYFSGLETRKELKALWLFHLFGLLLEIFKNLFRRRFVELS